MGACALLMASKDNLREIYMTKKLVSMFAVALMAVSLLVACGVKMPDTYDEQTVKDKAVEVVNLINAGDKESVLAMYRLPEKENQEVIEGWPTVESTYSIIGSLVSIKKITVKTEKDPITEEPRAVVTVLCKYEKGQMTYNVAFDGNNEVVGWYLSNQENETKELK